ncbi:hypothetical protein W97_02191 [Coniosporium apollinis CBS 100218]|uniref:Heterokaryon incompatibility domain-containing protein n=1 Tax=Coniosporium apollinis (strain CBS 100218) TaxID=1168221 RepID=R7YM29_CONA1|nr:uncharacterized protein W97_02191 [Coniosporium apollinis CBS 100218]EON62965.1 hypothetical protein W97_02191 [Coniosporium apollinis CBS 100218]
MLPYHYEPLRQADSFRTLLLHPGEQDDPITCSLALEDIKTAASYEAISYAWGNSNNQRQITCDRRSIYITASLWTALQRQRLPDKARRLWADAICINQQDEKERGHQVTIMGRIFKSARRVLVWLGPDIDGEAEDNFALLREVCDVVTNSLEKYGSYSAIPDVPPEDLYQYDELRWTSLARMFDLPWFSRLWIIQEVGLARYALMFYGNAEIEWSAVYRAAKDISQRMTAIGRSFNVRVYHVVDIVDVFSFKEGETQIPYCEDFVDVLYTACGSLASDPRDYIYAFLAHPTAKSEAGTIVPADYTLSTQQLYELLAIRHIEQRQDLHILSFIQHAADTIQDGTPSWPPRWYLGRPVTVFVTDLGRVWYDAAAGSKFWFAASAGHGVLHLRGLVFDAISFCSETLHKAALSLLGPMSSQITGANVLRKLSTQFIDTTPPLVYPQADRLKAFVLTLSAGRGWFINDVENDGLATHLADFAAYQNRAYDIARSVSSPSEENSQPRRDAGDGDWYRYARRAFGVCDRRRLFISKRGYLGLGPRVLQEGDLCCILYGATMPFILRRRDDHYILLGQSYIHGIMRGEAMEMLRNGELQEQTFEIH